MYYPCSYCSFKNKMNFQNRNVLKDGAYQPSSQRLSSSRPPGARRGAGRRETLGTRLGAYYWYCAYVLRIPRYSGFLCVVPTNTGIFLRGLKLCGKSRT